MRITNKYLLGFQAIIWDFDGVIKNSVQAKGEAFDQLFEFAPDNIRNKIIHHHLQHGGVSRFEKLEIYLSWCGIKQSKLNIEYYAFRFSNLVIDKVIASSWVPGVYEYLSENHQDQDFYLATATPSSEINKILLDLNILELFKEIYGHPVSKTAAVESVLRSCGLKSSEILYIGDSHQDYRAAEESQLEFLCMLNCNDFSTPKWIETIPHLRTTNGISMIR